jgi:methyl-accepting chemotaxis protein
MDNTFMKNHYRKINKAIIAVLFLVFILAVVTGIMYHMPFILITAGVIAAIAALTVYSVRKEKFEALTSYAVSLIMGLIIVGNVTAAESIYLIILPLCISALYLDTKLYLICNILTNIALVYKLAAMHMFSLNSSMQLIFIDITSVILLFLTISCRRLIKSISEEGEKASQSFKDLNITMDVIDENTKELDKDINNCFDNLKLVKNNSDIMTDTVKEVVIGVTGQADSIDHIYNLINTADEKATETHKTSKQLGEISTETSRIVSGI